MQMNRRLGRPGRARRVEPERDVVLRRGGGLQVLGLAGYKVLERHLAGARPARHDDALEERQLPSHLLDRRSQLLTHDRDRCATVVQHVRVIARLEQRVGGNGDGPDVERYPERVHELGAVGEQQQHALLHPHAEPLERIPDAVRAGGDVAVGEAATVVQDREPAFPSLPHVPVHEPRGGVEIAGDVTHDGERTAGPSLRTPPHTALEDPRPHGRGHGAISQPPRRRNDPSDRSGDCNMTPTIMACHSFVWVRVHFVWATKRRQPWIAPEWRERLCRHLAAVARRKGALLLFRGGGRGPGALYGLLGPHPPLARPRNSPKTQPFPWGHQTIPHPPIVT